MIPRCRPESARIWDAPLSLNALTISGGSPVLSPVTRAFSRGAVFPDLKGIPSIMLLTPEARPDAALPLSAVPMHDNDDVTAHKIPVLRYRNSIFAMMCRLPLPAMQNAAAHNAHEIAPAPYHGAGPPQIAAICPVRQVPAMTPAVNVNESAAKSFAPVI